MKFRSDVTVDLIDRMGSESSIVRAARVSTLGTRACAEESKGLLAYLYRSGHASPFEHVTLTFRVEAPIFVTREMLRHRLSSFNEESGRYRELDGVFYVPRPGRPLVQVGKVGEYRFTAGTPDQGRLTRGLIRIASAVSWTIYRRLLRLGIAREVARLVLPVNLYSTIYYTANLRSLLNFLSLRADWGEAAANRSKPQDEIQQVATLIAAYVQHHYPTVWAAFVAKGYQAV